MVERVTRKNENLESELPLTISAQYGLIDQNEFFDKRIASRDVSGYYLLKKGEFAYNKSTSSDAPWGAVKRLDRYEMGVLSTLYIVFALKENGNIDSDFLVSYYDTDCWHKGVQAIAAEGARNHGLLNITPADYFETVLTVPSDVKEQHQIGTFFAKLDSLITLHQREYFPFSFDCESAKTAQKTISWEQRKVGDVLSESRDAGHSGDIAKKLTVKLWGKGVYAKNDKGSAATQYFTRHAGQFIYSKLDFLNSAFGVVPQELESYESTADLPAFDCIAVDPYFMFYRAIQPSFYLTNGMIADGSRKAKRIHVETFLDMPLDLPSIEEQKKVASYFTQLDSLITLHQREYFSFDFGSRSAKITQNTLSWEQRELSDLIEENQKPVPKPDGEYIRLGIRSHAKGTFHEVVAEGEGLDVDTMYVVEANNLIVNITFAWEEAWAITTEKDAEKLVSHRFPQYRFHHGQYPMFYQYRFRNGRMKYNLELASPGGAGRNRVLNKTEFMKIPVIIPTSYEEEKKIGDLFANLDNLITLHQHKPNKKRTRRFNRHAL